MTSRKNRKFIEKFKTELESKGIDLNEFEDYFKTIEKHLKNKKYGLVWEEHTEDFENELKTTIPVLKEETDLSINKGKEYTNNLLIEGDNLESLTALKNKGKSVDVIEIDVPYNKLTESDFTYNDKRIDENDKFRHSKWLSFMDKRMKLAKDLLADDGVIFIHIDDSELYNLKLLCDNLFGEENFISNIVWESKSGGGNDSKLINNTNEYVLLYAKDRTKVEFKLNTQDMDADKRYKYEDKYVERRGKYFLNKLDRTSIRYGESMDYPITSPGGLVAVPGGNDKENQKKIWSWRWSKEKVEWGLKNGYLEFKESKDGKISVYSKQYQYVDNNDKIQERGIPHRSLITDIKTTSSHKEIKDIFGEKVFTYPKPIDILKRFISFNTKDNATYLDFFSGSGSLGHAILDYNKEYGTTHNFILATNNENNICREVTYERLKRLINGYTNIEGSFVEGINANLTYLKTELIDKKNKDEISEIDFEEKLIKTAVNNLKSKEDLSDSVELVKGKIFRLVGKETNYHIYNNFFIDENININLDKSKKNIIYVKENKKDKSQDNLLKFDEVRDLSELSE